MSEAEGSSIEHVCPKCGRSFPTKQGLSMHVTRMHVKPALAQSRPDSKGTAEREVIWKANGPTAETAVFETSTTLEATESELEPVLDELVADLFVDQTKEYLSKLREQIRFRRTQGLNDVELVDAFFLLYDDVQASV